MYLLQMENALLTNPLLLPQDQRLTLHIPITVFLLPPSPPGQLPLAVQALAEPEIHHHLCHQIDPPPQLP